jgi:hypothetical protein
MSWDAGLNKENIRTSDSTAKKTSSNIIRIYFPEEY